MILLCMSNIVFSFYLRRFFFVSLIFGWIFYFIFAKLTPFGIDLDDINKSPVAVGAFLFGYEIFLGLLIYGSLMIPLG